MIPVGTRAPGTNSPSRKEEGPFEVSVIAFPPLALGSSEDVTDALNPGSIREDLVPFTPEEGRGAEPALGGTPDLVIAAYLGRPDVRIGGASGAFG
jgi:hypothetical protein